MKKPTGRLPLFNLPSFAKSDLIIFCEGEKDCAELHTLGITATTGPMGADCASASLEDDGKLGLVDLQPLAGKIVVLWGDFDTPGRRHMQRAERILSRICPRPTIQRIQEIDVDGTKDAADFIKKHGDKALVMVLGVINRAIEIRPSDALRQRMKDIASGKLRSELWPFPALSRLSESLRPGSIVLIAGDPGNGKSLLVLQSLLAWIGDGIGAAYLALEEDAAFTLRRALAILSAKSEVLSDDWLRFNASEAEDLRVLHVETLDAVAGSLTTAPPNAMTPEKIGAWVESQAKSGKRIIIVDPITATADDGKEKPWTQAQNLMAKIKGVAVAHGISVVLVTHCKKNPNKNAPPDLDSLAGGAAYSRFSSAVFLLSKLDQAEDATVLDADGRESIQEITHRLKIAKSRDGRGSRMGVGFDFDGRSLRFSELGALVKQPEARQRKGRVGA
jgi:archaellum biogenesis ATPase FlaH